MSIADSVHKEREKRKKQKKNALKKLNELAKTKIELKRPVFFVPGWTDESNVCWKLSYEKGYIPVKEWISRIVRNSDLANYIVFTQKESRKCKSFYI